MTALNADIGGRLRDARQQRGLSLHDAARVTKLSINVLRAIERNDFESLPGGIYRKGYLRSLAREVGLDPEQIAADYDEAFEPAIASVAAPTSDVVLEHRWIRQLAPSPRRSVATLVFPIALAIGWLAWRGGVAPPAPAASGLIQEGALASAAAPAVDHVTRSSTGPTTSAQEDVPLRIEIATSGWCWVAAESDGERALYRLVEPGERVVLEGWRIISLRLGNAGSVRLSINDGPSRSAGGDGEVIELKLTPDNVDAWRDGAAGTASED
jgi:cytoskeleton protein RodZ